MNILFNILKIVAVLYVLVCFLLYFFQEKLIFFPEKIAEGHAYDFEEDFQEFQVKTADGILLNAVLFKADNPAGVIFYLHGNAGSINSWGRVASTYTRLNYDVFMLDYRGYGKSAGNISGEDEVFGDMQTVYDELKKHYNEKDIIVLGYSIGTGPASKIAATNNPRLLILQAPYYSLTDIVRKIFPVIPRFILKYKFRNNEHIKDCKMPVVIFHGNRDEVIYYDSSVKLKQEFPDKIKLITLEEWGHNGMTDNIQYQQEIKQILAGQL
jgi:uncharacterized protein